MSIICILGGLGYIGSHIGLRFLRCNVEVLLIDNLSNSSISVLKNIYEMYKNVMFEDCDINNVEKLGSILTKYNISTVIYTFRDSFTSHNTNYIYNYNIVNTILSIFKAIDIGNKNENKINKLIFASNVDIYTSNNPVHLENDEFNIGNPFSFLICIKEKLITDYYITRKHISVIILRLSVPVGSHSIFHDIYEDKNYITKNPNLQNNLLAHYIYNHKFNIYGCNYNTIDGSPNVNLLSVFDIGDAFWNAYMSMNNQSRFFKTYNIANNNVYTILQLIKGLSFYNQKNKITTDLRFYISNNLSHKGINRIYSIVAVQADLKWCPYRNIFEDISEIIERVQYKIRLNSILESDNENILIILNDEYQS
jgi:UDP-glucose 4-epimerase